ncbi:Formate dehydrogenase subunit alpha [Desulfamplus magnetovallimortis]|uniref:Formate dehydrogenase subunit alpha n=3 Tax=Desulfamplus magnetovallimortis TaxID=1246637 RepID=A0A1W1HFH3_9BACT|nr:Formate dehydrogenase subunit alpha [Desulfamplus magnetovallimortis]
MTNHWIDLKNSDCILIMGSNAAENHPISFKYVTQAMQNGAKLISVDPRFTRTSARADFYTALRSGTDIAFLGGMINYILKNNLYNKEYTAAYTNAPFIVGKSYGFKDGLFSGYTKGKPEAGPSLGGYDKSQWAFEMDENKVPMMDRSLENERCVFQLLKKHYSRYTPDMVSKITGTSEADLINVYKTFAETGAKGKAGTIMYAMGWTQHTVGTQIIRTMAIVQLLLGNMGIAGGGVNALRGESNVQGSTDHCLLWHIWPGYLKTPSASKDSLSVYNASATPKSYDSLSANWWQNYPKYSVSLLKSFFGEQATQANDFGYNWLPKVDDGKAYSWFDLFDKMFDEKIKGFFAWGQNPACSGSNAGKIRKALEKLEWMVNVNLFDNETGSFWQGPGVDPTKVKTEVFMLPASVSVEKEGSITNSGRWMQWRYQGPKPMGDSRPDGDIILELGHKIKELYHKDGVLAEPILNLKWDYDTNGAYDPHKVAKEINGYFLKDITIKDKLYKKGTLVPSFAFLQADGSTSSGNWLYCNSYTEKGNMSARRSDKDAVNNIGLYPEFAWCWPVNRRIIYNRASVDPKGQPWDKDQWVIKFEGEQKDGKWVSNKWTGDVPDGGWYPLENPDGSKREDSKYPFIMRKHGHGQIFGPGRADGPFPEHYEPLECPVEKNFLNPQRVNPTAVVYSSSEDSHATCDPRFPFVGTTYRVSEHWQTGLMTRPQPWLMELQPQMFVEMSEELAKLKGIKNGERVKVTSARASVECTAVVTKRFKPFNIGGNLVHQVGVPWHFGWRWPSTGAEESANLLTPPAGDPNTRIPETKAFMVNVIKL